MTRRWDFLINAYVTISVGGGSLLGTYGTIYYIANMDTPLIKNLNSKSEMWTNTSLFSAAVFILGSMAGCYTIALSPIWLPVYAYRKFK